MPVLSINSPYTHAKKSYQLLTLLFMLIFCVFSPLVQAQNITPGAARMSEYLPVLKGKKIALVINQTSVVSDALLVDTLLKRGVHVVKIFAPEHGFRGRADAGAHVDNEKDSATGLPVISLYGDNKKPRPQQLADVDVVVYDLQDVGVRFYTYISTLQYVMEACAENNKLLVVLDRPNPNGWYVDGPVLDTAQRSFVGMQAIPVVYGMTCGEYARMLKGERWCKGAEQLYLKVIPCAYYDHRSRYELPVAPSPNLKTSASVALYPSLCFFEGTIVSVGRGTARPFELYGHPAFKEKAAYSFTPRAMTGATKPLYEGQACFGELLSGEKITRIDLSWLIKAYNWYPDKAGFFNSFFEKLAGTAVLRKQIMQGMTDEQIHESWKPGIAAFKSIRKKYLLYKDFE
jgi:uncharacterized protein YbbC (DUF1343 family)